MGKMDDQEKLDKLPEAWYGCPLTEEIIQEINEILDKMNGSDDEDESTSDMLRVSATSPNATLPDNDPFESGYDMYSNMSAIIQPKTTITLSTGLTMRVPKSMYGEINASKKLVNSGIIAERGVIDRNFNTEIKVTLHNYSDQPFTVEDGDKIGMIVFVNITNPKFSKQPT